MGRIDGLGGWQPGDFLRNLQNNPGPAQPPDQVSGGNITAPGGAQFSGSITASQSVTQMSEFIAGIGASPQQSQMIQALVALMILIALLEQVQQSSQAGGKLLDLLGSVSRNLGQQSQNSFVAFSSVSYEQTTVTLSLSQGDPAAGADNGTNPDQLDVTA